jgi:hypothetical protein
LRCLRSGHIAKPQKFAQRLDGRLRIETISRFMRFRRKSSRDFGA